MKPAHTGQVQWTQGCNCATLSLSSRNQEENKSIKGESINTEVKSDKWRCTPSSLHLTQRGAVHGRAARPYRTWRSSIAGPVINTWLITDQYRFWQVPINTGRQQGRRRLGSLARHGRPVFSFSVSHFPANAFVLLVPFPCENYSHRQIMLTRKSLENIHNIVDTAKSSVWEL